MATTRTASASNKRGESKSRPIFSKVAWPVQVAVFAFANENGRPNYSVELSRVFRRDENDDWTKTTYLSLDTLLPAAKLLTDAYSFIQDREEKRYQSQQQSETGQTRGGHEPF